MIIWKLLVVQSQHNRYLQYEPPFIVYKQKFFYK